MALPLLPTLLRKLTTRRSKRTYHPTTGAQVRCIVAMSDVGTRAMLHLGNFSSRESMDGYTPDRLFPSDDHCGFSLRPYVL